MYAYKLISAFLKVNIQQALACRADMALSILMNLLWLGWELVSLQIIFTNTSNLSGWGMGELIALLGIWRLANTLMSALIWPNTERFNAAVRDRSFDYSLLQPVNSQGTGQYYSHRGLAGLGGAAGGGSHLGGNWYE